MKNGLSGVRFGLAAALAFGLSHATFAATELTVYTAVEAEDLKKYAARFNEDHPDIKINWVRDSTGIVTAKLLAEKENPRADVIWGLAATSLLLMKGEGMLHAYAPNGLDGLDSKFRDKSNPPTWTGMDAWVAAVCVNTVESDKHNLPMPSSWKDLTKPVYKGHIAMPNPNSSGTGFLDVSSWLQMFGEDGGWAFMDQLHQNIDHYTHSGSKPCKQAGSGEFPIGISWPGRAIKIIKSGAPMEMIIPEEGIGWEMQIVAIMKGTKNLEDSQRLIDWTLDRGMTLFGQRQSIIADPSKVTRDPELPNFYDEVNARIIDNKFAWAAANKDRIVAEWKKRYDGKTEPK